MAFTRGKQKMIFSQGIGIAIRATPRMELLEKKLKLVTSAEGKRISDVVADALESYLPKKWEAIMKAYNEDK